MPELGARQVPDLRLSLLGGWEATGRFTTVADPDETSPEWERRILADAGLWWVSSEMMDLLAAAMPDVPAEITPEELLPPDEAPGFVVFEKPLEGIDRFSRPLLVDAIAWGGSLRPILREGQSELAVAVSSYVRLNPEAPPGGQLTEPRLLWVYLGQSTWPVSDPLGTPLFDGQPEEAKVTSLEDRRLIAALWSFLAEPGIVEKKQVMPDRAKGRRHLRAGLPAEAAEVQVVMLRRPPSSDEDAESEPAGKNYSHRWVVSGHWRRQRVGPGLGGIRLVWVGPYVKGPPGKPLRTPDVVRAWVR